MGDEFASDDYQQILTGGAALLDVRAPVEFNKGAFPNSQNIPLLNDEARHLVGIKYKQAGQQSAIELGKTLLPPAARDELVQRWLSFVASNPDGYLYCFRGGLRSRITQQWLRDAGCNYRLVKGGYKALRQFTIQTLHEQCEQLPFCLIGGRTGTGKTRLLNQIPNSIDLEGLARHRGSSFGRMVVAQPSNIDFENAVSIAMLALSTKLSMSPGMPVYLEDEARMIGSVCIPEVLRAQTQRAPVAVLEAPLEMRVRYAIEDYVTDLLGKYQASLGELAGFNAFADYHRKSLSRVRKRFGGVRYKQALGLLEQALRTHESTGKTHDYDLFIEMILTDYYDPMYDYQMKAKQDRFVFTGDAKSLLEWSANNDLAVHSGCTPDVDLGKSGYTVFGDAAGADRRSLYRGRGAR